MTKSYNFRFQCEAVFHAQREEKNLRFACAYGAKSTLFSRLQGIREQTDKDFFHALQYNLWLQEHSRRQKMYQEFANIIRRINGVVDDIKTREKRLASLIERRRDCSRQKLASFAAYQRAALRCEDGVACDLKTAKAVLKDLINARNAWIVEHINDCEIGEHLVPGGKIVVGDGKVINFCGVDEATQKFANRCAAYGRDLVEKTRRINTLQISLRALEHEQDTFHAQFRGQLVDGVYIVKDGTVTIDTGRVIFHATN